MKFTPEEIAGQRELLARTRPSTGYPLWSEVIEWDAIARNTHEAALDEIERLREALNDAGNAIAKVVACCTYGSEEQAKFGAYGISHEAFTLIDAFIRKHGDLLNTLEGGE